MEGTGDNLDIDIDNDALDAKKLFNYVFGRHPKNTAQLPTALDAEKYNMNQRNLFSSVFGTYTGSPIRLPTTLESEEYNMNHRNRGKCLLFNNKTFHPHTNLGERRGTDVDANNLYWRFSGLNFKVERHDDKTVHEILDILEKAGKDDYTNDDCIVCCILSHGDMGVIYGTDGKFSMENVFQPFRSDVCPTLAGKPKLFFIQACQGDRLDEGIKVIPRIATDSLSGGSSIKIPTYADYLMAFSTVPGFYSWRNTSNGSWFIQGLCSVLLEYGDKTDLLSMMSYINRFVAYGFESSVPQDLSMHSMKQVPYITFTLTRKVFFRPQV